MKFIQISILLAVFILSLIAGVKAQAPTQTVRGTVFDTHTGMPLPGVSVILPESTPLKGTTTDFQGSFRLEQVSVDRIDIQFSMVGYKPVRLSNLLLVSGKELILNIPMEEQIYELEAIEVKPAVEKMQPINEMALASARSFSIEETERYAGSLGDPSRMAANFAGVSSVSDQRNDIVIRGNSPSGLLWRLEGVEIPNPNHFGAMGSTGGPVSILNNNLLANSDFYTGAFPAEFGNALAGAFDLNLRNGNNEQYEYVAQIGFNGFEFGAEGPLAISSQSSFLVNARYSTLSVFKELGMSFGTGQAVPEYADLAFKINFPIRKGKLSLFGMGGSSYIAMLDSQGDSASYGFSGTDLRFWAKSGVIGLNHLIFLPGNARLSSNLVVTGIANQTDLNDLSKDATISDVLEDDYEMKYGFTSKLTKKLSAKNIFNIGVMADLYQVKYVGQSYDYEVGRYIYGFNTKGLIFSSRAFAEWRHRFSDQLTLASGIHGSFLWLNNTGAAEPRLSLRWQPKPATIFSFGAGLHSQMQLRHIYFMEVLTDSALSLYQKTNENLGFSKSMHFVAGFEQQLRDDVRLKIDAYYQHLYHIPVARQRPEYSVLNQGGGFMFQAYQYMINKGKGRNLGVELTLEKFIHRGFYYLFSASLFDAKLKGYDGISRNSAFNNNFVVNALAGYELKTGKRSLITVDVKTVYAGGNRFLPINKEQSIIQQSAVYDWANAYEDRYPDYFRLNARIGFRLNGKNLNQEWALDLQNLTNHENIFTQNWNNQQQQIVTSYQMGFMPMMTYKIYF